VKSGSSSADIFSKSKFKMGSGGGALLLASLGVLCLCVLGCRQHRATRLTAAQVHQVTQELAKGASDAASDDTVIKIRRLRKSSLNTGVDELYIGLRGNAAAKDRVRQKLDGVATKHRLTVDAAINDGNRSQITLRSNGIATHHIVVEMLALPGSESGGNTAAGQARLAILLDDLGNDRNAAEAIFALHVPITVAVLPYKIHSQEIAQEARKRGCEVMLHLPMQSMANETPEQYELKPGLSREAIENMVTKMLETMPEADGVNNHQGSQATSSHALMSELMPVLKDAGVFYVDSRTTAETVAYDTAKRNGVKTAFRNVPFLDDVQNKAAVKRQLQIAIRGAREKGEAIAIGHPHEVTLEALREILPEAKKENVRLVFVSDLVH
jgi:polysaccharide deacetylase 2 family uncharacterized protein YibQ